MGRGQGCGAAEPEVLTVHGGAELTLLACETDAVDLTLRIGGRGEEGLLATYSVTIADALPSAAADPRLRRVCADGARLLSGGELVGAAFAAADFGLSTIDTLELRGDASAFFSLSASRAMTVSELGAAAGVGMVAGETYEVVVTATTAAIADDPLTTTVDETVAATAAELDVTIWVDQDFPSAAGDGVCQ